MLEIPVRNIPHQEFSVVLGGQNCVITLRQLGESLYASLKVDENVVFDSLICNDRIKMPTFSTTLFEGHLMFIDLRGRMHPNYQFFGDRMIFVYLAEGEG